MARPETGKQAIGDSTDRLAYSYKETAKLLSVSVRTVYHLIEAGKLKKVYITPKAPRITRESLLALLQEREEKVRTKAHGLSEVLRRFGL